MQRKILAAAILILGATVLSACRPGENQASPDAGPPGAAAQDDGALVEAVQQSEDGAMSEPASITLGYVGATAWLVTEVPGDEVVAELDTENPAMTLEVGTRYEFTSPRAQLHPFALLDEAGDLLLAQGSTTGALEQDEGVAFVDDGTTFAFTVTPQLAGRAATYVCLVHPPMEGRVSTAESG